MIIILSILLGITIVFLVGAILRIDKLKQHIELLDREQHTQNKDIIELLKYRGESSVVILQHSDVLTYLCDQDPLLNKIKMPISTIVGQA
jgi:Tfp pilus assembly protein PilN